MADGNLSGRTNRWETLAALANAKATVLADLVDGLERETLLDIVDVALNIIIGTIPTDELQLNDLRRHKRALLELTDSKTTFERRAALLRGNGLMTKRVLTIGRPFYA